MLSQIPQSSLLADILPSVFISHGMVGITVDPNSTMNQFLVKFAQDNKLKQRVRTAIIISGHWEGREVTVNLNKTPQLIHDHPCSSLFDYDFKFETDIELALKIKEALELNQIKVNTTKNKECDHGVWGGLFAMFSMEEQQKQYDLDQTQYVPKIVQVSMRSDMNPQFHLKLGQILQQFRNDKTMIICSGATTHSFKNFQRPEYPQWCGEWENWLSKVITDKDSKVRESLLEFKAKPMYPKLHSTDDHFIPLVVSLGTSSKPGRVLWIDKNRVILGSCYVFE